MHTQRLTLSVVLVASGVLTVAGCGSASRSGSVGAAPTVTGVHWDVRSVTVDGKTYDAPAGAHVEIDRDGKAVGNYGCNHFGATAQVKGDTITLDQGETTRMSCAKAPMDFEKHLARTLAAGKLKAQVKDGALTLTTDKGDRVALTKGEPAPLIGTKWTVTALVSGKTKSSLPKAVDDKAYLTFAKNGSVGGNLGCNRVSAKATVRDGHLTLSKPVTTRMMCGNKVMDVERTLLKLFDGKQLTYKVAYRGLTLTAQDGTGLAATAAKP